MRSPPSCTFPMSLIINSGYSIVARIFSSPFVNTTSDHYLRNENYAHFLIQFTVVSLFFCGIYRELAVKTIFNSPTTIIRLENLKFHFKAPLVALTAKKLLHGCNLFIFFPLSSTLVKRAWKAAGKAYRTCCRRLKWNLISNVPQITSTVQVDASARSEMKILFLVYEF